MRFLAFFTARHEYAEAARPGGEAGLLGLLSVLLGARAGSPEPERGLPDRG
jgi:hypothetical protein